MISNSISDKIKVVLPNKKMFLIFFFLLMSLTFGSIVALANENIVTVETDILNVRYGPGLSHQVLTQAKENDRLFLLGEENKWFKVRLSNDQVGWVASWLVDSKEVTQGDNQFARVLGEAVNIRQFSNTDSNILGTVYKDTELEVLYQDDAWYQVLYMGQVAWIHGDYLEFIEAPTVTQAEAAPTETTETSLGHAIVTIGDASLTNIRSIPSTEGEIIHTAGPGEQFEFISNEGEWYHIRINENQTGYVAGWVASITTDEDVAATDVASTESTHAQRARTATNLAEATIVIDAGHGGYDPGAVSVDETITEKSITLATAELLKERLQDAGTNVILTRSTDEFVSLNNRVEIAHSVNADLFISLHFDAMPVANSMTGTTTYYQSDTNLELANTVNRYLEQNMPLKNNGVRMGDYYVLRTNKQPSILLELGYMNNNLDTQYIDNPAYQSTVVEAIYQGLREYYGN